PDLVAGARVERAKAPVARRADEDEIAAGRDRAAVARRADVLLAFGQRLVDAERHGPDDLAGLRVDRDQARPRRRVTRQVALDAVAPRRGERRTVAEDIRHLLVRRLVAVARVRHHPADR